MGNFMTHTPANTAGGASDDDARPTPGPASEKGHYLPAEHAAIVRGLAHVATTTDRNRTHLVKQLRTLNERLNGMFAFSVRSFTGVANDLRQLSDDQKDSKAAVLRRVNSVNLRVARLEHAFEQADLLVIPEDERFFDKVED